MRPPVAALPFAVFIVALLVAGCGGGGSSAGSSSTEPKASPGTSGSSATPAKKATAPKAPAGSKVVSCGSAGGGTASGAGVTGLRAAGTDCGAARATMRRWRGSPACRLGAGDSRASCALGAYRCQAIEVDRGAAVSCARADGGDVSFIARRRPGG